MHFPVLEPPRMELRAFQEGKNEERSRQWPSLQVGMWVWTASLISRPFARGTQIKSTFPDPDVLSAGVLLQEERWQLLRTSPGRSTR